MDNKQGLGPPPPTPTPPQRGVQGEGRGGREEDSSAEQKTAGLLFQRKKYLEVRFEGVYTHHHPSIFLLEVMRCKWTVMTVTAMQEVWSKLNASHQPLPCEGAVARDNRSMLAPAAVHSWCCKASAVLCIIVHVPLFDNLHTFIPFCCSVHVYNHIYIASASIWVHSFSLELSFHQ